jgi:hypothetical protein
MNYTELNENDSCKSGGNGASRYSDAYMPDWDQCLRTYRHEGAWDRGILGPPPGGTGCSVPPQLLQYYGYDVGLDVIIDLPCSVPGEDAGHTRLPNARFTLRMSAPRLYCGRSSLLTQRAS